MKVSILIDESLTEEEIIIKCPVFNERTSKIQQKILDITSGSAKIIFHKDNKDYYLDVDNILFFEIEDNICYAHTLNDIYLVKYRLYELEDILPKNFVRISKGAIVNINRILAISSSFGGSTLIEFNKSHKQVYVSRRYIKLLKYRLKERR